MKYPILDCENGVLSLINNNDYWIIEVVIEGHRTNFKLPPDFNPFFMSLRIKDISEEAKGRS